MNRTWNTLIALTLLTVITSAPGYAGTEREPMTVAEHEEDVLAWRDRRHARLSDPKGWLTLVGFDWLREGRNRVGSAPDSDLRLAGGPAYWGTVVLAGDRISFERADDPTVTVDGERPAVTELVADNAGEATRVAAGTLHFYVIHRGNYALRVKDTQAPVLAGFDGVDNFDIDRSWRVEGRLLPSEEGQTVEIGNVLGQLIDRPVVGTFEFEHDGSSHRLLAFREGDDDRLWFIFADRTSGRETYGGGRFVYSEGMPEDGRLVVDFNKAYNPPCVFTDYSTCELPPMENRLPVPVSAGEKVYGKGS